MSSKKVRFMEFINTGLDLIQSWYTSSGLKPLEKDAINIWRVDFDLSGRAVLDASVPTGKSKYYDYQISWSKNTGLALSIFDDSVSKWVLRNWSGKDEPRNKFFD